jgi:hypothetical protein
VIAFGVVITLVGAATVAAWVYFRRVELMRPPIGVFDWHDVVFMLVVIVVLPIAYLTLPKVAVGVVLCLLALNVFYFGLEPLLRFRALIWPAAVGLVVADVAMSIWGTAGSGWVLAVNDFELVALAVFVTNMLAQSGLRARELALLVSALAVYDVIATFFLGLMSDVIRRLATLPFAPLVAWREGGQWLGLGLGDLLVVALAPLVFRRAFGRTAGILSATTALTAVAAMLAALRLDWISRDIPALVVLGPLLLPQYVWWRGRRGRERQTWEYLEIEAPGRRVTRDAVEATRERAAERRSRGRRGEIRRGTTTTAIERR